MEEVAEEEEVRSPSLSWIPWLLSLSLSLSFSQRRLMCQQFRSSTGPARVQQAFEQQRVSELRAAVEQGSLLYVDTGRNARIHAQRQAAAIKADGSEHTSNIFTVGGIIQHLHSDGSCSKFSPVKLVEALQDGLLVCHDPFHADCRSYTSGRCAAKHWEWLGQGWL